MRTEQASRRRWFLSLALIGALLLAQALGLAHRTAHDGAFSHPHSAAAALFDAHDEASPACQLYDQLSHADLLLATPANVAHASPAVAPAPCLATSASVARATHFLARAPPRG